MTIELYLIRHAIAVDAEKHSKDEERPLTPKGEEQAKKVAARLNQIGNQFDVILTSPLIRARQTADILKKAGLSTQLEEFPALAPDGDINTWLKWLEPAIGKNITRLALIGHQPDLGKWAEILVWGEFKEVLILKKSGIIGLKIPKTGAPVGRSLLFWLTSPKFLV